MDVDQRLAGIEARLTLLEETRVANQAEEGSLPVGTPLSGVLWIGLQLWTVEGHPGFWCSKREHDGDNGGLLVRVNKERCKGRSHSKHLYPARTVTERLEAVVEGWLKQQPDAVPNANGKEGE